MLNRLAPLIVILLLAGAAYAQEKPELSLRQGLMEQLVSDLGVVSGTLKNIKDEESALLVAETLDRQVRQLTVWEDRLIKLGLPSDAERKADWFLKLSIEHNKRVDTLRQTIESLGKNKAAVQVLGKSWKALQGRFTPLAASELKNGGTIARRDPFTPSEKMLSRGITEGRRSKPVGISPAEGLPRMTMRGFIEDASGTRIALVEIEKLGSFIVRLGDKISYPHLDYVVNMEIIEMQKHEIRIRTDHPPRESIIR